MKKQQQQKHTHHLNCEWKRVAVCSPSTETIPFSYISVKMKEIFKKKKKKHKYIRFFPEFPTNRSTNPKNKMHFSIQNDFVDSFGSSTRFLSFC